ncbi:ShlB/FhaC/HecB family hemolysin secretion/activation protein, partial [Streptomyces sp. A1136]
QAELQEFIGQELDFNGLRRAGSKVTNLYRERGYIVARAYLPAQEIRDGKIAIAVREGVIGQVSADTDNNVRLNQAVLQRYLDELQPGTVIRESELEGTLLRLSDLAGVSVRAVLRPSSQAGATDIVIRVSEMTAITSRVSIDNYGNYYTGAKRLSANINLNDALGLGESFGINTQ